MLVVQDLFPGHAERVAVDVPGARYVGNSRSFEVLIAAGQRAAQFGQQPVTAPDLVRQSARRRRDGQAVRFVPRSRLIIHAGTLRLAVLKELQADLPGDQCGTKHSRRRPDGRPQQPGVH